MSPENYDWKRTQEKKVDEKVMMDHTLNIVEYVAKVII